MSYSNSSFDVIILAGGESKRFGEDKCDHEFNGITFLQRVSKEFSNPIIITNKLRANLNGRQIIDHVRKGPVRGLEIGIQYVKSEKVFVTGCDFPFVTHNLAEFLCGKTEFDISIVRVNEPQPLLACYSTSFLSQNLSKCKRMMDLLSLSKKTYLVGIRELEVNKINLLAVKNVNTWLDLNFSIRNIRASESKLVFSSF